MEVRYEDMIDDLESWGRKTTEFLGLQWQAQQIDHKQRAAPTVVKSPTPAPSTHLTLPTNFPVSTTSTPLLYTEHPTHIPQRDIATVKHFYLLFFFCL